MVRGLGEVIRIRFVTTSHRESYTGYASGPVDDNWKIVHGRSATALNDP
jgi:hypothetical protein